MPAGERRKGIKPAKWRVDIPQELAFRFERLPGNYDHQFQRPIFGKRSQILTKLIEDYVYAAELLLKEKAEAPIL
jgi:hypothetical protein